MDEWIGLLIWLRVPNGIICSRQWAIFEIHKKSDYGLHESHYTFMFVHWTLMTIDVTLNTLKTLQSVDVINDVQMMMWGWWFIESVVSLPWPDKGFWACLGLIPRHTMKYRYVCLPKQNTAPQSSGRIVLRVIQIPLTQENGCTYLPVVQALVSIPVIWREILR